MKSVSHWRILIVCCGLGLQWSSPSLADTQNSYPMLMGLHPVAAQVGQTSVHEVDARYSLEGAYQILFTGTGITGEVVPPEQPAPENSGDKKTPPKKPTPNKLKVRITVSPDALPGVRDFRIATPLGVSTIGQLVIVRDPVVSEQDDNNTVAKAQEFTLPATLCGRIERMEDIDLYKFK